MSDDGLDLAESLTDEQVAQFLSTNPDFFIKRDELLSTLTIPHQRGEAISLVERQVSVLRERNQSMRTKLNELLSIARDNDSLFERVRRLVLTVQEADTLDEVLDAVDDSLSHEFRIDYVSPMLVSETFAGSVKTGPTGSKASRVPCHTKADIHSGTGISDLLTGSRVVCGRLREQELKFLFPNHWKMVKSTAVVSLHFKRPLGILAVGSRSEDDFRAGTGTIYLNFIGEVVSRALETLAAPRP
ncbi:DUF484 family protein [Sansalvadorimonas verongulae]|uniref:DUF484 family protein n=1 Tax=Sansalvadorimonas verongulae TaxID=2172824 RepID=UPI0012BCE640|nr:DUF484 family protein [Sansalvadorimonas verongulae]MTI14425.1 DUF484 family protein [Sansalvadorimonas verongulae]